MILLIINVTQTYIYIPIPYPQSAKSSGPCLPLPILLKANKHLTTGSQPPTQVVGTGGKKTQNPSAPQKEGSFLQKKP